MIFFARAGDFILFLRIFLRFYQEYRLLLMALHGHDSIHQERVNDGIEGLE